jgi:pimeloyl-ACP methyl ester carboxylesterase
MFARYLAAFGADGIAALNIVSSAVLTDPAAPARGSAHATFPGIMSCNLMDRALATGDFVHACSHGAISDADFQLLFGAAMVVPPIARAASQTALAGDYRELFGRFSRPLLITHGEHDTMVLPHAASNAHAVVAHAQVSMFPGAGHMPFWRDADRFDSELAAFATASLAL